MARTILVGDVHGCLRELEALLGEVAVAREDRVILVGDLVAKGPDSQGVVQLCRERGLEAVLGNHDAWVLRIREGTTHKPPKATHREVAEKLGPLDWAYLQALPAWRKVDAHGVVVVHAGLVPGVPLHAQEKEHCITLRSITPQGAPSRKLEAGAPWASLWPGPEHVVFGHDALRGLQQHPHATGLDTGCVYGGALTALVLPGRRLVRVPARKVYADPGS